MAEAPINISLYPEAALPKSGWPKQMLMQSVIDSDIENVLVSRKAKGNLQSQSRTMRGRRFLTQDVLDEFVDHDLSMNLIGGGFLVEHCRFRPVNGVDADWDGASDVQMSDIDGSIVEDEAQEFFPATYFAYNLHICKVPYYKQYSSDKEALKIIDNYANKLNSIIVEEMKLGYVGSIELTHKPTIANYWHVTLNFRNADGVLIADHKKWKKDFVKSAVKIYMEEVIPNPSTYTRIFINPEMHGISS